MAIIEKEEILVVAPENIPEELQMIPNWVLWRAEWNENRKQFDKIPYQINGSKADSTDSTTWNTFRNVVEIYDKGNFDGIGMVLTTNDSYSCIDIDGLSNIDDLPILAQEIVNLSYAELSPSKKGLHVWVRYIHNNLTHMNKNTKLGYEIYSKSRFMTFTGEYINKLAINEGTAINSFIDKVFKRKEPKTEVLPQFIEGRGQAALPESDIVHIAGKGKQREKFNVCMYGGWEPFYLDDDGNPDQSSAVMGFLNILAFYTNCDYKMMDSIFRKSNLMYKKWDRPQNSTTWGDEQLKKAILEVKDTFTIANKEEDIVFPKGYNSKHGCLYKVIEKEKTNGEIDTKNVMICRQTPVITRSFMNIEYPQLYHELTWTDKGKQYKETVLAGDLAIKKELLKLSYQSLAVTDINARDLIEYFDKLNMNNQSSREQLVERLGHIKTDFIHPLASKGVKVLPPDVGEKQIQEAFEISGTTEDWIKNVFEPIKKHPKALLMVLASFTSVILHDLKMKPFIIDLSGVTSQGKTTVLRACASVWGNEYLVSEWNLSKVAAERKAAFLNSFPLILDDTRKADQKELQQFVYNFSGGRSKGRGSITGSQREHTWNNLLLSTGEDSLNSYAERAGGVAARILPITGLPFEGENYQFFGDLYESIEKYYGSVGLDFLNHWSEKKDKLILAFKEYNDVFQKKSQGNEVIGRIARYYAAIIFTGKMLNDFFGLKIDLMQLYHLFDELNANNKSIDKPMDLLEQILSDLDSDRGSIFREYELSRPMKAIYKDGTIHLLPKYLKEFLQAEQTTIRSEWQRREITVQWSVNGKETDNKKHSLQGKKFNCVTIKPNIIEKLGFDFSEKKIREY